MELNTLQKDKLTEVASIAFGNAATSLNILISKKVEVATPILSLETVETASDRIGTANEKITEVMLRVSGDLSGIMLMLFDPVQAKTLEERFNQGRDLAVLPEIGNIFVGNALKAISKFLNMNIYVSIPDVATDMRRALIVSSVFQLGEETDQVLLLGTTLTTHNSDLQIQVYFLFDDQAVHRIIDAI